MPADIPHTHEVPTPKLPEQIENNRRTIDEQVSLLTNKINAILEYLAKRDR